MRTNVKLEILPHEADKAIKLLEAAGINFALDDELLEVKE